jgi:D-alanine-D-alanine ligase
MRVCVLFYESPGEGQAGRDVVVSQVATALGENGHQVSLLGISNDLRRLIDWLAKNKPEMVFNLCETFDDIDAHEMHVAAVLEMIGQPFTGTGPASMAIRQDKALTKKVLAFHGVLTPQFATFEKQNIEFAGRMRFPMLVKPLHGDASMGIHDASVVNDYKSLLSRISFIHGELSDAAIVEEYIDGREIFASFLGNPLEPLPLVEIDFSELPLSYPRIFGREAKFDVASPQYNGTTLTIAEDLTPETSSRVVRAAVESVRALGLTDYGRVDIRLAPDGSPYVVEVNANPYLEQGGALATAAQEAGIAYPELINRILACARKRWFPPQAARAGAKARLPRTVSQPGNGGRLKQPQVRGLERAAKLNA